MDKVRLKLGRGKKTEFDGVDEEVDVRDALGSLGVGGRYDGDARVLASVDVRDEVGDVGEREEAKGADAVEDDGDVVGFVLCILCY